MGRHPAEAVPLANHVLHFVEVAREPHRVPAAVQKLEANETPAAQSRNADYVAHACLNQVLVGVAALLEPNVELVLCGLMEERARLHVLQGLSLAALPP